MKCVKTDMKPFHIFLTGGAGVGKTAVITAIYQMLIRYYNKETGETPDDVKVLLGAPTGKAAFLIHGYTLHNLFHIPASQGFAYKALTANKLNTLRCKLNAVKVLIIDEISMVGNQMFNFIHQRLQQIMGTSLPFGGLSVIAVGDLYQLKPVFDGWIFDDLKNCYGPLAINLWREYFNFYELTQIMRQKDDQQYALLLNRLRTGTHTSNDINILQTRTKENNKDLTYPLFTPHIFLKNELHVVNMHNNKVFLQAPRATQISINAFDIVVGDVSEDVKIKIKSSIPNDCTKTMGLMKTLQTAIGLRVELSTNVDVEDGLANGASCTVKAVHIDQQTLKLVYIWVKFDYETIGKNLKSSNQHLYQKNIDHSWVPIAQVKRQFKVGRYKVAEVLRCQFPLRPSAAKTAHRCQGDTMESAFISFQGHGFPHVHYVALSRVKSLDQLFISNFKEASICVSQKVKAEMTRLQDEKKLEIAQPFSGSS